MSGSDSMQRILRALSDQVDDVIANSESDDAKVFDPVVFWSVNGFVFFLVSVMVIWCCFADKSWLTNSHERRQQTDEMYQQTVREREARLAQRKIVTPEKRKKRLLQSFRRHKVQMVVTQDDLSAEKVQLTAPDIEEGVPVTEDAADADAEYNTGSLRLPGNRQPVPNCCAVCLGSYDVGETVVWSSNQQCAHAFHEECILEWLIKMQPATPCPCCRQEFTDLESVRKESKIIWAGGETFALSAVGF